VPFVPHEEFLETVKSANSEIALSEHISGCCEVTSMPRQIALVHTTACNISCFMCQKFAMPGANHSSSMSGDLIDKIAREAFLTLRNLCLTIAGEPLVDPGLPLILKKARSFLVGVSLVTNGLNLDEAHLRTLLPCLDDITVSIDGASKATYEGIRRGSSYEKVLSNIRLFNRLRDSLEPAARPRLILNYVLMRRNVEEMPEFVKLARDLDADEVNFNHVVAFNRAVREESLLNDRETANFWLTEARKTADALGIEARMPLPYALQSSRTSDHEADSRTAGPAKKSGCGPEEKEMRQPWRECPFLWSKMFIEVDGDVSPCCADHPDRPRMGNIGKQDIGEIWQGSLYSDMRRRLLTERPFACCLHCDIVSQAGHPDDQLSFLKEDIPPE
jgi:radical SAM protein with 4Fe4S-binding SPASM domain